MSSKHPEDVSEGAGSAGVPSPPAPPVICPGNPVPDDAYRYTPALRPDVWTEADIEEMDRLAAAGIGKRTRIPRRAYRLLDFRIGERCIQAKDGDTVYMVTNELLGHNHVAYYRNNEVGWTELGRGLLTECIQHCLEHYNTDEPYLSERERFAAYLEWATKEVATWPEWKRRVLG